MKGKRSDVGSATDSTVDPHRYWNSMRDPSEGQLSDCVLLSSNVNIGYQNSAHHEEYVSSGWSLGESSLVGSHNQVILNDSYQNPAPHEAKGLSGCIMGENSSSGTHNLVNQNAPQGECPRSAPLLGKRIYLSSESPSHDNLDGNQHAEQVVRDRFFTQSSTPQNLLNVEFTGRDDDDDDDCQVIECDDSYRSGSSFQQCPGSGSSSRPFITPLDSRRLSFKRKTLDASADQSSQSGSSSCVHHIESSLWQGVNLHHNTATSVPVPAESIPNVDLSDQSPPRLGLRVGRPASDVPFVLGSSGTGESSRRNFSLRINNLHQQDCIPGAVSSTQDIPGNPNVTSAHRMLRLPPISDSFDLFPSTVAEDGSHQRPTIATLRQNSQSRWYGASRSGIGSSSSVISAERAAVHEELNSRSIPTVIPQHPVFEPASEIANSYQTTGNWGLDAGNFGVCRRTVSSSGGGSSSGVNSPAPLLPSLRNAPHYPRRPSEFSHRSLIPQLDAETGNQDSSYNSLHSDPATSSPDLALPSGSSNHRHPRLHSRSAAVLLERNLGSTLGIPYSSRSLAASGEGRSRLVSEIRNVLDLMRRGEGLASWRML
ncbi:hypothetical protein Leryth_012922 [Lithospermum erythrorhizon]|nr:hypothetical protein Leryth_012922 [Lithospermum erythrorhizon]